MASHVFLLVAGVGLGRALGGSYGPGAAAGGGALFFSWNFREDWAPQFAKLVKKNDVSGKLADFFFRNFIILI